MKPIRTQVVLSAIRFIEENLDEKLDLEIVAEAVHYSKYHLHRIFTKTVGMTVHDYVRRRQLTEAAKLLVFSDRPILEISLRAGFESQQAFTAAFTAMYKEAPGQFREKETFYPLQLAFKLKPNMTAMENLEVSIELAKESDIPAWMELVRLAIDGFPCLIESEYLEALLRAISENRSLIMRDGDFMAGVMIFSYDTGCIEFMGTHPLYRKKEVPKVLIPSADSRTYKSDYDSSLLYIACTRAMHRLTLLYTGEATCFINQKKEKIFHKF